MSRQLCLFFFELVTGISCVLDTVTSHYEKQGWSEQLIPIPKHITLYTHTQAVVRRVLRPGYGCVCVCVCVCMCVQWENLEYDSMLRG